MNRGPESLARRRFPIVIEAMGGVAMMHDFLERSKAAREVGYVGVSWENDSESVVVSTNPFGVSFRQPYESRQPLTLLYSELERDFPEVVYGETPAGV